MYWYTYEIAVGHDTYSSTNFEDYFESPLRGRRVPLGSVTTRLMDFTERTDGEQSVELTQEGCTWDELDAYVTAVFGGWEPDAESVAVTLRHRKRDNTFAYFNALAHFPTEEKEDYRHETTQLIADVRLRFTILEAIADPE